MADQNSGKKKIPAFVSKLFSGFQGKKTAKAEVPQPLETEAPATVHYEGQKLKVGAVPDGNTLVIEPDWKVPEKDNAATRIQSAFRRFKARELYEQLRALRSMNLEIRWPSGNPFIGFLIVRVTSITALQGVKHPLLRAKCDGDQTINVPGGRDKHGDIQYDDRATFCFVVIRSSTVITIEVLQSLELATRILGKVNLPVSDLAQGVHDREEKVLSPAGKEIGTMKLTVGYGWSRGTHDDGGYEGPAYVFLPARKFRGTSADKMVERLWQVNHWLCSHDNIWCASQSFADLVKLAVEKKREEQKVVALLESGPGEAASIAALPKEEQDIAIKANLELQAAGQGVDLQETANLLTGVLGENAGARIWESYDATMSSANSLGSEDWRQAVDQMQEMPMTDDFDKSCRFDSLTKEYLAELEKIEAEEADGEENSTTETSEGSASGGNKQKSIEMAQSSGIVDKLPPSKKERQPPSGKSLVPKHEKAQPTPAVTGKFEYGAYRPASQRGVHVFMRRGFNSVDASAPSTVYLGCKETSRSGRLHVELPEKFLYSPGHYLVLGLLPDDNTFGRGSMFMLEPGTQCVVFDLDGTVTTSDAHVVAQVLLDSVSVSTVIGSSLGRNYDLKQRASALTVCRAWAAKGYQVVYLSGRQGSAYNMTKEWLIRHGYPPGPIHLTRTHLPTLPVYVSVGHFKVQYMRELVSKGLQIAAAYGNTGTDIKAYEKAGIPKDRTFIVGPHGGKLGTVKVKDFTTHMLDVMKFPNASKPIPYTELLLPDLSKS
ncbi:unnamed protein product [Ostreobium quekettii]|uniref:LNS2/PITP domain-containing protein n=1 Tax=Ostreobium quekettii TaxID=121088 RepID=A0A8S1J165_9CHLO|nr:unnamed protein product [Ostreobium quekettii]